MLTIAVRLQNALPGRTTRAEPLTNSWSGVGDGEKTASGERCRGSDRRGKPDTGRKPETRKRRKHGQLRSCRRRREALTGGPESLRGKGLAPQVKQRVFDGSETLAKRLIRNGLLKPDSRLLYSLPIKLNGRTGTCTPPSSPLRWQINSHQRGSHSGRSDPGQIHGEIC